MGFRRTWYHPDKRLKTSLMTMAKKIGTKPKAYKRRAGDGGAAKCSGVKWNTRYRVSHANIYSAEAITTVESCVYNGHNTMNFRVEIGEGRSDWAYSDRY